MMRTSFEVKPPPLPPPQKGSLKMSLTAQLPCAHDLLRQHIHAGDTVLDGTAGNGHDTLLLAQLVGSAGKVYAFDIQDSALAATADRLQQHQLIERVQLIHAGHQHLARHVKQPIAAAIFNMGYLPRGDHNITTQAETSIAALQAALALLQPRGILIAVLYHGHEQGKPETAAILSFAQALPQTQYRALRYEFINQQNCPPIVLAIEKLATAGK